MRFRSGTLQRSVKRWGRNPFSKMKRKQFDFQYVESEENAVGVAAGTLDIVVFDATDWGNQSGGVRNVSLDLRIMYAWSPATTTLAYDSWYINGAMFVLDANQSGVTLTNTLADTRALWWNAEGRNSGEQPSALGVSPENRYMNWRCKATQRFMKFDDELRYLTAFNADVSSTISDARCSIFGRISWEVP